MPHEEPQPRPFRRTFAVLGVLFFAALAVLAVGAVLGFAAPALFAFDTAMLLTGGALAILLVTVPVALFALHRYTHAAAANVEAMQRETHTELHAAHDSLVEHAARYSRSNEAMHGADREQIKSLRRRIDDQAMDIQARSLSADLDALERSLNAKAEQIETAQERQWVGHVHSHTNAEQASQKQWTEANKSLNDMRTRLEDLEKANAGVKRQLEEHATLAKKESQESQDGLKALRLLVQQTRSDLETKLSQWQAPESQLAAWAERVNGRTDHELARFRHKMQRQLRKFEERETQMIDASARQGREEAALLAEDILHERITAIEQDQDERMRVFKRSVDEQFAAFLAGQQAQQTENEARLAAIGATRGVKVQGNQAYSITSHAPFGRIYPISDIEGIGNKTAYTLQGMGILDTEHLWHADVPELAAKLGVTTRQIRQWQSQAELMAIEGIGPQWGEVLAVSGVMSIGHLANLHGRELLELIQAHGHRYRAKLHKGVINLAKAEDFIERARTHKPEAVIRV